MNYVKSRLKKIYNSDYFPFFLLFFYFVVLHIVMNYYGDDIVFQNVLNSENIIDYLHNRYNSWSSRIIVESLMLIILQFKMIVWKTLDIIIIILLSYSISYIFVDKDKRNMNYLIALLIILYPIGDMATAGWIATTMNYLWPLSLGLYSITLAKKVIKNVSIKKYEYLLYIIALIYASNVEQAIIWLIPSFLGAIIINYHYNKKHSVILYISLFITIFELILIINCPGNINRTFQETQRWMPDFGTFSFVEKLYLGISDTITYFTTNSVGIFFIFTIIICSFVNKKYNNNLYILISMIPVAFVFNINLLPHIFPVLSEYANKYYLDYKIDIQNYDNVFEYLPIFLYVLLIGCIIISIYLIFDNLSDTILCLYILTMGLITRIALGFSPTLYASSTRTFLYLYFSFIIVIVLLIANNKDLIKIKIANSFYKITILAIANLAFLNNFIICYQIGR